MVSEVDKDMVLGSRVEDLATTPALHPLHKSCQYNRKYLPSHLGISCQNCQEYLGRHILPCVISGEHDSFSFLTPGDLLGHPWVDIWAVWSVDNLALVWVGWVVGNVVIHHHL